VYRDKPPPKWLINNGKQMLAIIVAAGNSLLPLGPEFRFEQSLSQALQLN
jgi:hypothetical protein